MVYYISLYPTPNYFRHFIVEETTPLRAIHKVNYFARLQYKLLITDDPQDMYSKAKHCKDIVLATRRYKRTSKPRWKALRPQPVCFVYELPLKLPWEGQLNIIGQDREYAWNILQPIPLEDEHVVSGTRSS
jgi:hypothetical protein